MEGFSIMIMMSGDSPSPLSNVIFELKDSSVGLPTVNAKCMIDKGVQCSPPPKHNVSTSFVQPSLAHPLTEASTSSSEQSTVLHQPSSEASCSSAQNYIEQPTSLPSGSTLGQLSSVASCSTQPLIDLNYGHEDGTNSRPPSLPVDKRQIDMENSIDHIDEKDGLTVLATMSEPILDKKLCNSHTVESDSKRPMDNYPEEEEDCAMRCLYYTVQCCECVIL
uniref:Uncharacterized protein n=1 Tax=Timema monikensis TaxID=170555 RepID=A0A7R9EB14_9NEOP|nr:unnamed protein product [Timema monikensis]